MLEPSAFDNDDDEIHSVATYKFSNVSSEEQKQQRQKETITQIDQLLEELLRGLDGGGRAVLLALLYSTEQAEEERRGIITRAYGDLGVGGSDMPVASINAFLNNIATYKDCYIDRIATKLVENSCSAPVPPRAEENRDGTPESGNLSAGSVPGSNQRNVPPPVVAVGSFSYSDEEEESVGSASSSRSPRGDGGESAEIPIGHHAAGPDTHDTEEHFAFPTGLDGEGIPSEPSDEDADSATSDFQSQVIPANE